jgi:F-type H+-transporting ATPase subunit epsilon
MSLKINCTLLTLDEILYEGSVELAIVQSSDGEMGFLYNHAPLVTELGFGEIRLYSGDSVRHMVIEGGFAEIRQNELTILAESAFKKESLSLPDLQNKFNELTTREKSKNQVENFMLQVELKKVKARLKVASR